MNWYKNVKLAAVRYMYHGTSINNLSSILSEGLNTAHGNVYDSTFQNRDQTRSIESYGGIYFTNNLRTAVMSGSTAAEKNKIAGDTKVIVIAQLEDTTPNILIDEDVLSTPFFAIQEVINPQNTYNMANWIASNFPNMEVAVNAYLKRLSQLTTSDQEVKFNQFTEGLKPYIPALISSYAIAELAKSIKQEDWGTSELINHYPQFKDINMDEAIEEYRNALSIFMQKAHRLTSFLVRNFQENMRIMEPLSFRGKNKIVLISTFQYLPITNLSRINYNEKIEILYLSNTNVINQYISDIKEKYGDLFIMTYQNNVIYDKKRNQSV